MVILVNFSLPCTSLENNFTSLELVLPLFFYLIVKNWHNFNFWSNHTDTNTPSFTFKLITPFPPSISFLDKGPVFCLLD